MTSVYKSTTHGSITLSFTGKRLLANLRDSTIEAINKGDFSCNDMQLSKDRAKLALYISELENRKTPKESKVSDTQKVEIANCFNTLGLLLKDALDSKSDS